MHNGSPAVLGMQDIDKLGLISITEGGRHEHYFNKINTFSYNIMPAIGLADIMQYHINHSI